MVVRDEPMGEESSRVDEVVKSGVESGVRCLREDRGRRALNSVLV
mgnify:CR=1 FL=1